MIIRVDHTFMDTFFAVAAGMADVEKLNDTVGFQTITCHARHTGNTFSTADIDKALKGAGGGYGLKNLSSNLPRIEKLWTIIKEREGEWTEEICAAADRLFAPTAEAVTIIPVIGYDQGIGINNRVCVNLNSEACLQNYHELVSVLIHEVTHTLYESIHGPVLDLLTWQSPQDMKNLMDNLIQYEGAGVFSAKAYREKFSLPVTGSPIQEDYNLTREKIAELFREYQSLSDDLSSGKLTDAEEFVQRGFGPSKLTHRLGYAIFCKIFKAGGAVSVRNAVAMANEVFIEKYVEAFKV